MVKIFLEIDFCLEIFGKSDRLNYGWFVFLGVRLFDFSIGFLFFFCGESWVLG